MPEIQKILAAGALAIATLSSSLHASAAQLTVLSTGAFKQVAAALVPLYEARSGNRIVLENDTAGGLAKRIEAGASFDLVILTPDLIKELVARGKVVPDSVVDLARVGIGVVVPDGAALPDISSVAHFRQALLDARSVAYIDPASGGSSGIYLAQLFRQWGIASQIDGKVLKVQGGSVAEHIARGEATLGLHQISEILPVKGVTLVGPLPAEIQNYTVYTAAISSTSVERDAARAYLRLLTGPEAMQVLKEKGLAGPSD